MRERISEAESINEMRREARDRIMSVVQRLSEELNLVIKIEDETPETITLEFKNYHKGFMKVLKLPNGSSIEEEIENQIRFPERDLEGD